ncbi:MAG: BamA/TamA family outer membrane protein, partial [Mangrovicoccus sp.]
INKGFLPDNVERYEVPAFKLKENNKLKFAVGDSSGEVDDDFHLRSVVGVSLFWDTPLGPLRFDFTEALQAESYDDEQSFDFSISASF